jgi:hypothetical protein
MGVSYAARHRLKVLMGKFSRKPNESSQTPATEQANEK